jgi:hypothetical protein
MTNVFLHLNWLAVIVTAVIGFLLGWLWYSPVLFAKPWMAAMKITPERMQETAQKGMAKFLVQGFIYTVISTIALAMLVKDHAPSTWLKGAMLGAFIGALVVGVRMLNTGVWEQRPTVLKAINVGHEIVLFAVQAAILTVWP